MLRAVCTLRRFRQSTRARRFCVGFAKVRGRTATRRGRIATWRAVGTCDCACCDPVLLPSTSCLVY
eukprot:4989375-Prymnesium_polylepis.1